MVTHCMADSSSHRLPTELTDAIMDHLHDDKDTLLQCSVVCSSWLQPSRYHLFHDIRVDSTKAGRSFPEFLTFLYNAPNVCAYIRCLSLRSTRASAYRRVGPFLLCKLFDRLPFLRDLELDSVFWEHSLEGYHGESLVDWPFLHRPFNSLALRQFMSDNNHQSRTCQTRDIFEILSIFSSLKTLELERIWYSRINELPSGRAHSRLHLNELQIGASSGHGVLPDQPFFDLFRERVILDNLHRFNVRCRDLKELQLVGSFMQDVNLTELSLDLSHMQELASVGNESIWSALQLSNLTSLKSLSLHVWTLGIHTYGDVFTFVGQWCLCSVSPILSYVSPTVERLSIVLSISGDPSHLRSHLESLDWTRLQNEFDRMTALESIVFEIRQRVGFNVGNEAFSTVMALVENKLSALVANGMLEVI